MHVFRSFRSKGAAPLTVAAAGLWASSSRFERRTAVAEPAATARQVPQDDGHGGGGGGGGEDRTGDRASEKKTPVPPPIGPMVAVFLDESSVDKLKAHFPEARDGQLRKVLVQYGPSAKERDMYRHLFNGKAEVTVTGDASSFARRALVASVSNAGRLVEPVSLSAAIDISPPAISDPDAPAVSEKDGPGPLASAVLIEQVKKAGATKEELWEGTLPPLLAHDRQFPSESGAYVKLKEPITVHGTICRADWVDGASNTCRDTLDGGGKREEDWEPSDCSICAFFSVSPCNGIFNRFVATSKRRDEYLKTFEPDEQEQEQEREQEREQVGERKEALHGTIKEGEETASKNRNADADKVGSEGSSETSAPTSAPPADARVTTVGRAGTAATAMAKKKTTARDDSGRRRASATTTAAAAGEGGGVGSTAEAEKKPVPTAAGGNAAQEGRSRQAERDLIEEQLEKEALEIFNELKECMIFHDLY